MAAARWGRSLLLGGDHFKFRGGALYRKGVRDCLREKHLSPPLEPRDRAAIHPGSPSAQRLSSQGNSISLPVRPQSRIPSGSARTLLCDLRSLSPPWPVSSSVKQGCRTSDLELQHFRPCTFKMFSQIPLFLKATSREVRGLYPLWTDEKTEGTSLVHAKAGNTDSS